MYYIVKITIKEVIKTIRTTEIIGDVASRRAVQTEELSLEKRVQNLQKAYISEYLYSKLAQSRFGIRSAADDAGIPYSTFNSILRNPLGAGITNVTKICKTLNIPVDILSYMMDHILLAENSESPEEKVAVVSLQKIVSGGLLPIAEQQYLINRKSPIDFWTGYLEREYAKYRFKVSRLDATRERLATLRAAKDQDPKKALKRCLLQMGLSEENIKDTLKYIKFLQSDK